MYISPYLVNLMFHVFATENMLSSDGSLQSGDVFSSITQITSIAETGKEPIQAQSVQSTGRLKRNDKGREILTPKVCFTIPEEEEVEIPLRNVKARILKEEERVGEIKEKRTSWQDKKEEILRLIDRKTANCVSQKKKDMLAAAKAMFIKAIEAPDHI
ncbi:hypothetical protein HanRHA438_Chr03g0102981 [Helianthus annuus]|nr:hypothetical protein HanHA89_Chr03g0088071 [Helianthus annuus]KAJ0766756.1 hypothetical protein HanLR1_Chr03g0081201 [Helianthus annuus]KAJ0934047.1 hypothetical protein HanRHA438_Chr03g0102981 [Helianthus annuus]KAJ0942141.1 hypothetical protein HanPSC8_Chr03g0088341 [Helianthus annuus]